MPLGKPTSSATPVTPASAAKTRWFENDYPGALAEARARKLPLFVDASAVWCHTCLAMRAFVLDDPALEKSGFVWLTFDVEGPANEAAASRYSAKSLPTFFVVDPADGSVHGRWEGAATLAQVRDLLRDGRRSIELAHAGGLAPGDPLALLLAGHRAEMSGDHDTAAASFTAALAAAPSAWSRRPDALLALVLALKRGGKPTACLDLAVRTLPGEALGRSSTLADFGSTALDCAEAALAIPHPSPTDTSQARTVRSLVADKLAKVALDPAATLSPDDRGDALRLVWDAKEALGDHPGALEAATHRLEVLERAATAAPNAAVASTFDGARMETLIFLGRAREALVFLSEHERALPEDYNPSHRLAVTYEALGELESALTAIDRALAKAWGARKARLFEKRADILVKLGRSTDARATLEAELSHLGSLPPGQRRPELEKTATKRLSALTK